MRRVLEHVVVGVCATIFNGPDLLADGDHGVAEAVQFSLTGKWVWGGMRGRRESRGREWRKRRREMSNTSTRMKEHKSVINLELLGYLPITSPCRQTWLQKDMHGKHTYHLVQACSTNMLNPIHLSSLLIRNSHLAT